MKEINVTFPHTELKLTLQNILQVSPGTDHIFAEEIVAVNAKEKRYCVLGELRRHAVVTPDIDSLLDGKNDSNA